MEPATEQPLFCDGLSSKILAKYTLWCASLCSSPLASASDDVFFAQVLGVHLGIRHGPGGQQYGPEVMGDAVAALVQLDDTTPPIDVGKRCPSAWEQLVRWI